MFAVYGISGPIFQGTLEELQRVPTIEARPPVTPLRPFAEHVDLATQANVGHDGSSPEYQRALAAYHDMLPQDLERGPLYHADQIMQKPVISVGVGDAVAHAWQTLLRSHIRQAPVLDDDERLVGLVGERNLLTALNVDAGQVRDVLTRQVRDVMRTPVVAAGPLTDIRRIARVMLERDVDGVPVVTDHGVLLGFISRSDILRAVVSDPPLSMWR